MVQTRPGTIMASSDVPQVTVTRIAAGTDSTIIPETAELEGTIRALSEHTRVTVHEETRRVCDHGYPVTVNDAGFVLEALTS